MGFGEGLALSATVAGLTVRFRAASPRSDVSAAPVSEADQEAELEPLRWLQRNEQDSSPIHEFGRRLEEARGLFADTDVRVLF
jgi:hypothetical protein